MLESLYGLPGKIKTLLDRLTAARAGYLDSINPAGTDWNSTRAGYVDRLDAAVSTRAPASTALSNATWTDARAGYQDRLDTTVSSRAPASTALSNATWTDARATKQDNLDTTVSSRAPSSTALSTATWTATRAGYLDNLNATVSSRADGSIWTSTRAGYIDTINSRVDTSVSSRADGSIWTSTRAGYIDTMIGRVDTTVSSRAAASTALSTAIWTNDRAGYLDVLPRARLGLDYFVFLTSGTWTVPAGIYLVRFRVVGGGSGALSEYSVYSGTYYRGGAGGGFSMKTISTTPGTVYNITVGAGGVFQGNGGTSSVDGVCSATGGIRIDNSNATGGSGSGGDINTSGGNATNSPSLVATGSGTQYGSCAQNSAYPVGAFRGATANYGKFPFYMFQYGDSLSFLPGFGSGAPGFGGGSISKGANGGNGVVIIEW